MAKSLSAKKMLNTTFRSFPSETVFYRLCGYVVMHTKQKAGTVYQAVVKEGTDNPLGTDGVTLYTKGRVTGVSDNPDARLVTKTAGFFSRERTRVPSGVHTYTVEEDAELWCFYRASCPVLPNADKIVLAPGESLSFNKGEVFGIVQGDYLVGGNEKSGKNSFTVTSDSVDLVAVSDVYGFIFKD